MSPETSSDERHEALEVRPAANTPAALVAQVLAAVRELTVVPVPAAPDDARGEGALFFPAVGLALGGVAVGLNTLLPAGVSPIVRATILVAWLLACTGGRHFIGLARTVTAPGCASDGTISVRGVSVAMVFVVVQIVLVSGLTDGALVAGLLFAPMLSRWSMVAFAFGSRTRAGGTVDDQALRAMKFREFAGASVLALGVTLTYTQAWGLVVILAVGLCAIGTRVLTHGAWGGIARPLVDTVGVCNETLAFAMFWLATA